MSPRSDAMVWSVEVKIDGALWDRSLRGDLKHFVWRDRINEPPVGELAFFIDTRRDAPPYRAEEAIGKQIEVTLTPPGVSGWDAESDAITFKGEVHSCEHEGSERGDGEWRMLFRHKAYRLTRKAGCKMWQSGKEDDAKHDDIIKTLAGEAGLNIECESADVKRISQLQYRETDFNFLQRLVEDLGCWMVMHHDDSAKVSVTKSANDAGSLGDLDVADWTVVVSSTPTEVELSAPPKVTEHRVGVSKGNAELTNSVTKRAIGAMKIIDTDVGIDDAANAATAAKSLLYSMGGEALRVEGTVQGRCYFAGDKVTIPKTALGDSTDLAGSYLVIESEVVVDDDGVNTSFTAVESASTVLPPRKAIRPRIDGVMRAIVTNSENGADEWGRIRVKFPWADDQESAWAQVAQDWAGPDRGSYFLPHVDDEVLVAFEHGDPSRPIVIGSLYNSGSTTPHSLPDNWTQSIIKTKVGHTLIFEDKDGSEFVEIKTGKKQHYIKLDDANENIEIKSGGGHFLKLDDQGKKVQLKSAGGAELTMDDNGQKVTLKVGGCSMEMAPAGITIKAPKVEVKGDAQVSISAPTAEMKGDAKASVEGAMTEVKGSGMLKMQGAVTMIN